MRRSRKEAIVLDTQNRLLHNGVQESNGMGRGSFAIEAAEEWISGQASVRNGSTPKPPR